MQAIAPYYNVPEKYIRLKYYMSGQLKVIQLGQVPKVVGQLCSQIIKIGRDPGEGGITINNSAISREHGTFVACRDHWIYSDNGSTNGSWFQERKLTPGNWCVVREGKLLRLADTELTFEILNTEEQISSSNQSGLGGRSLLVFKSGEFVDEYTLPEYGRALVIGGRDCHLPLTRDTGDAETLVIERKGSIVEFLNPAGQFTIKLNGEDVNSGGVIQDGDELVVCEYQIFFNDPSSTSSNTLEESGQLSNIRGWGEQAEAVSNSPFNPRISKVFGNAELGQMSSIEEDSTEEYIPPGVGRYGTRGTGTKDIWGTTAEPKNLSKIEDRIILAVGIAVTLALLLLIAWWLFN